MVECDRNLRLSERGRKMKRLSITIISVFLLLGVLGLGSKTEGADKYPVKPITFIVAIEAGSDGDILARPLVQKVSAILGQPIVVVNKPGGGSSIGYRELHDAKPDGYTIGWERERLSNKLQGLLPYDHQDFTVVGTYATYIPIIVASTKTKRPFKTIEEVISFAKSHPGEISMATGGVGQMLVDCYGGIPGRDRT